MTKTLDTLVKDIQQVISEGAQVSPEVADRFGKEMSELLVKRLTKEERKPALRMSSIGKPDRQLWYEINKPELAEKLHPNSYMKFLIGDIIESVVLTLAEIAGHEVTGQQDEMTLSGIKGHRDAVMDGTLIDVKSASPYSFKKFEEGLTHEQDAFGYLTQINSYLKASENDPLVTNKDEGAFIVVQKVTGDITVDKHQKTVVPMEEIFEHKKSVVTQAEPPERCYQPEPMGKSGNMKLGINCSYCSFKKTCYPELRTFLYATGPVFLTEVSNEPRVIELDHDGNVVEKEITNSKT